MNKMLKIMSNIIYGFGVLIVTGLCMVAIFGSNEAVNPDNMIPFTWKEEAFLWLSVGSIPMLFSCMAAYKFNGIKNSTCKKRNAILLFLPCLVCTACGLFIVGLIGLGMINSFLSNTSLL